MELIIGYILAILVGISLGLMGSGGSILTLPIFVYLFHVSALQAIDYSLFIIGITAFIGSVQHLKSRNIDFKTAVIFGLPSLLSVYITRRFIVPAIPHEIRIYADISINKSMFMMLIFAMVMLCSAYSMIRKSDRIAVRKSPSLWTLFILGIFVGLLTGLVGAGGGFLIIPSFVLIMGMSMKKAIGTSLFIIAINSLIGFGTDFHNYPKLDWTLLIIFSLITIIGLFIGTIISSKIDGTRLKVGFGWFILAMGVFIILSELIHTY